MRMHNWLVMTLRDYLSDHYVGMAYSTADPGNAFFLNLKAGSG